MTGSAVVTWDDALTRYDFGPGHPFDPVRLRLTMALASELGVLASPAVTIVAPSPAPLPVAVSAPVSASWPPPSA